MWLQCITDWFQPYPTEECGICYEDKIFFVDCDTCHNKVCTSCHRRLDRCAFCRTKFIDDDNELILCGMLLLF